MWDGLYDPQVCPARRCATRGGQTVAARPKRKPRRGHLHLRIRTLPPAGQHDVLVATLIAVRAQQAREHVP